MALAAWRGRLLALIGDAGNGELIWTDELLDEGLRGGLVFMSSNGPVAETSVTVASSGPVLSLTGLEVWSVSTIAWPWVEGARLRDRQQPWRTVGPGQVALESGASFVAGDVVRVRYHPRHALAGLDGATVDTLGDGRLEQAMLYAAAAAVLRVRARALRARPEAPLDEADAYERLCALWIDDAWSVLNPGGGGIGWW